MRYFKRIAAVAVSATMLLSTMSLNAFAAMVTADEAAAASATDLTASDLVAAELDAPSTVAPGSTFKLVVKLSDSVDKTKVLNVGQAVTTIAYDTTNFTMSYVIHDTKPADNPNALTWDDISYASGRNYIYFALNSEEFVADNGKGKAMLGGMNSPYKIIPTSDFAIIDVKVADNAPVGQYKFTVTEVAALTPDSSACVNTNPYEIIVNVSNDVVPTEEQ